MTEVIFLRDDAGLICGFKSEGHTGYGDKGEDIVCAGISALVINTVNSLERLTEADLNVTSNEIEGLIECEVTGYRDEDVQLLLKSLVLGTEGIRKRYGDKFVRIEKKEV